VAPYLHEPLVQASLNFGMRLLDRNWKPGDAPCHFGAIGSDRTVRQLPPFSTNPPATSSASWDLTHKLHEAAVLKDTEVHSHAVHPTLSRSIRPA
jgi:hypothetical protein